MSIRRTLSVCALVGLSAACSGTKPENLFGGGPELQTSLPGEARPEDKPFVEGLVVNPEKDASTTTEEPSDGGIVKADGGKTDGGKTDGGNPPGRSFVAFFEYERQTDDDSVFSTNADLVLLGYKRKSNAPVFSLLETNVPGTVVLFQCTSAQGATLGKHYLAFGGCLLLEESVSLGRVGAATGMIQGCTEVVLSLPNNVKAFAWQANAPDRCR